jgi:hypothetical protein
VLSWLTPVGREVGYACPENLLELESVQAHAEGRAEGRLTAMFEAEADEAEGAEAEETTEELAAREAAEALQADCMACGGALGGGGGCGVRVEDCRHVICRDCARRTLALNRACPLPRCTAVYRGPQPKSKSGGGDEFSTVITFGNTAQCVRGDCYAVTASVTGKLVASVAFDINPAFPKSAVRVAKPPFELARTMESCFPCDMHITWAPSVGLPKLVIGYTIQVSFLVVCSAGVG